jgi:hypothetical protein
MKAYTLQLGGKSPVAHGAHRVCPDVDLHKALEVRGFEITVGWGIGVLHLNMRPHAQPVV